MTFLVIVQLVSWKRTALTNSMPALTVHVSIQELVLRLPDPLTTDAPVDPDSQVSYIESCL